MEHLPAYISLVFVLTIGLAIWFLYRAAHSSRSVILLVVLWLTGQSLLALTQFYTVTNAVPPRLVFLVLLPLLLIVALFVLRRGRLFLNSLDPQILTLLHVVRLPVELVLFWLALHGAVPHLMTFAGRNFDIVAGLTAPLICYFGFVKNQLSKTALLTWNFICLGLLLNIVFHGILSAPTPFQQFAFDQPNIALLYFPFVLLPGVVVPLVLFAHVVTIRHLLHTQAAQPDSSESPLTNLNQLVD